MNEDFWLILNLAAAVGAQMPATPAAFEVKAGQPAEGIEQDFSAVILFPNSYRLPSRATTHSDRDRSLRTGRLLQLTEKLRLPGLTRAIDLLLRILTCSHPKARAENSAGCSSVTV
jgi:hypothetical protein